MLNTYETLEALRRMPEVQAQLERQRKEQRKAHQDAIDRLHRAQCKAAEVEAARNARRAANEKEFAPIRERYETARAKYHGTDAQIEHDIRVAQIEAMAALAAIAQLARWQSWERWTGRIDTALQSASLRIDRPPLRRMHLAIGGALIASEKERAEFEAVVTALNSQLEALTLAYRATVASARVTYSDELEAIEACRKALQPIKEMLTLPNGMRWDD
jgi:hypothetical protein